MPNRKTSLAVSALTLGLGLAACSWVAPASPINLKEVSADSKWVLHLDGEAFLKSTVGNYAVTHLLEPKTTKLRTDLKEGMEFEFDWRKIHGLTIYGTRYQPAGDPSALVVVRSAMDFKKALDNAIQRKVPKDKVERLQDGSNSLYRFRNEVFIATSGSGLTLFSKSRDAIDQGLNVLSGESANLAARKSMAAYPEAPDGFFFMAVAEDFAKQVSLPDKASLLKQAEGARLVLAEKDERLRVALSLKVATSDVAKQIQQVAQGLIALGALNADKKPELYDLVQGATVNVAERVVSVDVVFPVDKALKKMEEKSKD